MKNENHLVKNREKYVHGVCENVYVCGPGLARFAMPLMKYPGVFHNCGKYSSLIDQRIQSAGDLSI